MSDMPENYFLNGKEMLGFRKEPIVIFPGAPVKSKKKKKRSSSPHKAKLNERDGNLCHYCKLEMAGGHNGPFAQSVEHIVPRSLGGGNSMYNLVLAHRMCNEKRGSDYIKCLCLFCKEARRIHENPI